MFFRGLFSAFLIVAVAAPAAAQEKQPPYWASLASGQALRQAHVFHRVCQGEAEHGNQRRDVRSILRRVFLGVLG